MLQIGPTTTREQRVTWNPDEAVALLQSGTERSVIALAMFDQLEAAGMAIDAIGMQVMFWSRALDGCNPGPVPPDRLARLDSDLSIDIKMSPVLGRWIVALRRAVVRAEDLDYVIQFFMQVHQTWTNTVQFRPNVNQVRQQVVAALNAAAADAAAKDADPYWTHGHARPQRWVQRAYNGASGIVAQNAPGAGEPMTSYLARVSQLVRALRGTGPDDDDESWYDSAIDEACAIITRGGAT